MIRIPLTQGLFAVIDDEDESLVAGYKWHAVAGGKRGRTTYAERRPSVADTGRRNRRHMHRLLLNPPDALFVDHINGDGLDNRRVNLRVATREMNGRNRHFATGVTGLVGIAVHAGQYRAAVGRTINGVKYKLIVRASVRLEDVVAARASALLWTDEQFLARYNKRILRPRRKNP